jgi:hypothetical protein
MRSLATVLSLYCRPLGARSIVLSSSVLSLCHTVPILQKYMVTFRSSCILYPLTEQYHGRILVRVFAKYASYNHNTKKRILSIRSQYVPSHFTRRFSWGGFHLLKMTISTSYINANNILCTGFDYTVHWCALGEPFKIGSSSYVSKSRLTTSVKCKSQRCTCTYIAHRRVICTGQSFDADSNGKESR